MHDDALYGEWELSRPDLSSRSYLYSLPPIGTGTAAVESLTCYISRLAAAHAVETGTLVNRELLPRIPCTKGPRAGQTRTRPPAYSFYLDAHALNGTGDRTRLWVYLLEQMTYVQRLDILTALPWANAISCVHLLRSCRAWCPLCYENWRSSEQPVYEPLLWAFQIVTVCPEHRRPLETGCHSCGRKQYVFSSKTRPGHCSRCQCWLGREQKAIEMKADLGEQIAVAEMVGELLAASLSLPTGFNLDVFRENVRSYTREAGGCLRFRPAMQHRHIRGWIRRMNIPRLDSLVELSRSQKVSVVDLLTERIARGNNLNQKRVSQTQHRVASSVVEEALQAALRTSIPPPLPEIASQLGYRSVAPLQSRFRVLCNEIASRRSGLNSFRARSSAIPVPRDRIEKALMEELSKPGFTDLKAVAASVGLSSKRRLYKDFRDLRVAIVTKNAQFNRRGTPSGEGILRSAIEGALRAAFNEETVPTVMEVALRLGFAGVRPVTSRFPELTTELRSCRRSARLAQRGHPVSEHIRQILSDALAESPAPSCSEIVKRVAGHRTQMREAFPDLWSALRTRHVEHKREVRSSRRQAFADDVFRAVEALHQQGVYPSVQLVLASIPAPQFRSENIVAEAVHLAQRKLLIKASAAYWGHL